MRLLQARNPDWVGVPFFAKYDPAATWLDELRPAFGQEEFFFEPELRQMIASHSPRPWLQERKSLVQLRVLAGDGEEGFAA
jgi:hypothetical protein